MVKYLITISITLEYIDLSLYTKKDVMCNEATILGDMLLGQSTMRDG